MTDSVASEQFIFSEAIRYELERNAELVSRILSDVSYQSADNLVDGLTRYQEENMRHRPEDGGYVCSADIFYGRPKRAENTFGEWKVIVNLPDGVSHHKYTQTSRFEQCTHPGDSCHHLTTPGYKSQCLQKHSFVRLLAYTYEKVSTPYE